MRGTRCRAAGTVACPYASAHAAVPPRRARSRSSTGRSSSRRSTAGSTRDRRRRTSSTRSRRRRDAGRATSTPTSCSTTARAARRSRSATAASSSLAWPELTLKHARLGGRDLLRPHRRRARRPLAPLRRPRPWSCSSRLGRRAAGSASGRSRRPSPTPARCPILGTEVARRACSSGGVSPGPTGHPARPVGGAVDARDGGRRGRASPAVGYFAQIPHYVSGPYALASLELLQVGGAAPRRRAAARRPRRGGAPAAASGSTPPTAADETTRAYVERLESMVDESRLPAGDDLIADIERFLRDRGGDGAPSGAASVALAADGHLLAPDRRVAQRLDHAVRGAPRAPRPARTRRRSGSRRCRRPAGPPRS